MVSRKSRLGLIIKRKWLEDRTVRSSSLQAREPGLAYSASIRYYLGTAFMSFLSDNNADH